MTDQQSKNEMKYNRQQERQQHLGQYGPVAQLW